MVTTASLKKWCARSLPICNSQFGESLVSQCGRSQAFSLKHARKLSSGARCKRRLRPKLPRASVKSSAVWSA